MVGPTKPHTRIGQRSSPADSELPNTGLPLRYPDMSPPDKPTMRSLPHRFPLADGRECLLRNLVEGDAEACCALLPRLHDETDFINWVPGEFTLTVEQERDFIRARTDLTKAVTVAAVVDDEIIGLAGAWSLDFRKFNHHAELGVSILRDYWGLGIGGRMMQAMFDWTAERGLHKLYLRVFAHNERAHRWYTSLGFIEEGRLKDDVRRADGSFADTIVMAKYFA